MAKKHGHPIQCIVNFVLHLTQAKGFFDFIGGLPTSKVDSGQQWDFPNVWPPLQWLPVIGWYNSSSAQLRIVAEKIANKFISTVFNAWLKYNQTLYEKVGHNSLGQFL